VFYHEPNLGPCGRLCHNLRALSATCRRHLSVPTQGAWWCGAIFIGPADFGGPATTRNTYMTKSRQTRSDAASATHYHDLAETLRGLDADLRRGGQQPPHSARLGRDRVWSSCAEKDQADLAAGCRCGGVFPDNGNGPSDPDERSAACLHAGVACRRGGGARVR
jgi:hypothetical protein